MTHLRFTEETDAYTVLSLRLDDYKPSLRALPDGFKLAGSDVRPVVRAQEKKLLQQTFEDWQIPFREKLRGWRDDSPLYVLKDRLLVGGLYVCAGNEFDDDKQWGQLHYFFVRPEFRGKGLHSLLVNEAVQHAKSWGLQGIYINTDRFALPEVYARWGARVMKQVRKPSRIPHNRLGNMLRRLRSRTRLAWQTWFSPLD